MTDTRLFAAMLRAVLNLEHWPTDVLEREVQRLLDIAGLELAPAGASLHYAATFEDGSRLEMFHVEPPPPPAPPSLVLADKLAGALHRRLEAPDPRVEMDARTRRVSAGLEAPPPGVVTTFTAVPDAALPRCPVCAHLEHGSAVCGTRVPLEHHAAVDARVPDTCQCEGEPPAPALEAPERFPDHMDETCRLGRDTEADADATLRRYGHRVFIDIGLEGVGATLELDRFHIAGAVALLTEAQRHP